MKDLPFAETLSGLEHVLLQNLNLISISLPVHVHVWANQHTSMDPAGRQNTRTFTNSGINSIL